MKPTLGSLFAGIGGIDLGFERAGFETVWQVEINPYCRKVLERHFPNAERFEDVRTVGAQNLRGVDVIAGGFPCQDISLAGKGAGITGERSGLWREYARIIGELRPKFVFVENVAALIARGIDRVLGDLAELGYDAEWEVISAAAVGAQHLRRRLWIVAYPCLTGRWQDARGTYANEGQHAGRTTFQANKPSGDGQRCGTGNVADAGRERLPQRSVLAGVSTDASRADARETAVVGSDVPKPYIFPQIRAAIARGECGQWLAEPNVGRVANGVPSRVDRLRGLGNAVVPQIPELIANRIRECLVSA